MDASNQPPRSDVLLIVDDEPDILMSFKVFLEGALKGVTVLSASSGREALALLKQTNVDLIITDYKMPGMNGVELLKALGGIAPDVPRIMVTAYPDLDVAVRAINEGHITQFLTKPVDPMKMVDVVHQVLHERHGTAMRHQAFARAMNLMRTKGVEPVIGVIPATHPEH